ncbi:MAG: sigma-70 family RNA polymerase sigma factor [Bacteroidales bacterium]|nr:sigma-70 family RNA polymerase sigma factor [Bacteroidales bacterium]
MADSNYENLDSIILGCVKKEEKAQEELYKKYFGYALSIALLYSNNRNDAIETVNDSFIKVFKEIKKFNISLSFKPWLRKIIINSSLDRIRKSNRRELLGEA